MIEWDYSPHYCIYAAFFLVQTSEKMKNRSEKFKLSSKADANKN